MTGATATAIGIGVASSVAGAAVSTGISALTKPSGGGGGGGSISSGGSGATAGNSSNSLNDTVNPIYGVHVSSQPLTGEKAPKTPTMTAPKAIEAKAENPRSTPTQSVGAGYASKDFQGVWADRLSRYLDYNTRQLG